MTAQNVPSPEKTYVFVSSDPVEIRQDLCSAVQRQRHEMCCMFISLRHRLSAAESDYTAGSHTVSASGTFPVG